VRAVLENWEFCAKVVEVGRLLREQWVVRPLLGWSFVLDLSRFCFGLGFGFVCGMMVAVEEGSFSAGELLMVPPLVAW
jgi:hypothetical protein